MIVIEQQYRQLEKVLSELRKTIGIDAYLEGKEVSYDITLV